MDTYNQNDDVEEQIGMLTVGQNTPTLHNTTHNKDDTDLEHDEENEIDVVENHTIFTKFYTTRKSLLDSCGKCNVHLKYGIYVSLLCLYLGYFSYALYLHGGEHNARNLIVLTCILFLVLIIKFVSRYNSTERLNTFLARHPAFVRFSKWFVYFACIVITCVTLITEVVLVRPANLVSITGILAILLAFFVTSTHPHKVSWRPVLLGLFLQYVFALAILRFPGIKEMFQLLGKFVENALECSKDGGRFLFGSIYSDQVFVLILLPQIIFVFAILSILEHVGVLGALLRILGRFLAFCTGASPAESLNASANIFMGPIDALMFIRPYLKYVTESELHCMMSNAMSTVTGSIMGVYIALNISADHLLAASVMSAPAALAVAKLAVPERSRKTDFIKATEEIIVSKRYRSVLDAFSSGAVSALTLVAAILANIIAVVSFIKMINAVLLWLGQLVDVQNLTLQYICSYLFYPLALSLGVNMEDGRKVGELIGMKIFINEVVAYEQLGKMKLNRVVLESYVSRNLSDWHWSNSNDIFLPGLNQTLHNGVLSHRSEIITTYALCGFANFISVGIILGCYLILVPHRKSAVYRYVFRSMLVGQCASFLTACIAGLFVV